MSLVFFALWKGGVITVPGWESVPKYESIAVLPLEATEAYQHAAHSISQEFVTKLTQVGVPVIPWITSSRYSTAREQPRLIAKELKVDGLLTGSLKRAGNRVWGSVRLVDGRSGENVWEDDFDEILSDFVFVQRHIAMEVARKIKGKLTGDEESSMQMIRDQEGKAFQLTTQGFDELWRETAEGDEKAFEFFSDALKNEPTYAKACMGLAAVFYRRGGPVSMSEGISKYELALELDPSLIDARLGLVRSYWEQGKFEDALAVTVDLPPATSELERLYLRGTAYTLCYLPQGIETLERALTLDPGSPGVMWYLVMGYGWNGRYQSGVEMARRFLRTYEADAWLLTFFSESFYGLGLVDSAMVYQQRAADLEGETLFHNRTVIGALHAQRGEDELAREIWLEVSEDLSQWLRIHSDDYLEDAALAMCFALLGDVEGFEREKARLERHPNARALGGLSAALATLGRTEESLDLQLRVAEMGLPWVLHEEGKGQQFWANDKLIHSPRFAEVQQKVKVYRDRLWEKYGVEP